MEGKKFSTLLGNQIEWHTDPDDMPPYNMRRSIIVAFSYRKGVGLDNIADNLYFSTDDVYLGERVRTYCVAWAYIDRSLPEEIQRQIIEERKKYERDHADEIRAKRIAELEAELSRLKGE